jgi:hypothetical protein
VAAVGRQEDGRPGDDLDILPDPNYRHLISYLRGNNPLPWQSTSQPGVMHLETYPLDFRSINHTVPWSLDRKPDGQPFQVRLRNGTTRDLQAGDHVRVTGWWVIDHHPEYCQMPSRFTPPEPERCRNRGWLRVGQTHTELHPFDWQNIALVEPPAPYETVGCRLSLAAPLYEEQYVGDGHWLGNELALVSGRIFIDTDPGTPNFHAQVSGRISLAPPPPDLPASAYRRLTWYESVVRLGAGLDLGSVRTVTTTTGAVDVDVRLTAVGEDGGLPPIAGPAQGRWIYQADYFAGWTLAGDEISCILRAPSSGFPPQPGGLIWVGGVLPDGHRWWMRTAEAIAALRAGHRFFVLQPLAPRREVVVVGSGTRETLGTQPQGGRPDPLLELPPCPAPPVIT